MQSPSTIGKSRSLVTGADGHNRTDGVGRRRLLLSALSLLTAGPVPAGVSGTKTLLDTSAVPMRNITAYTAGFADFRREAAMDPDRALLSVAETAALTATGEVRLAEAASFLREEEELAWVARHFAAQLAAGAPFDHRDGGGRHPADRIALLHRRLVGVNAENLYTSSAFDPDRAAAAGRLALDNLMQSPGHRENILDPRWTHAGFGAALGREGFVLVQLFVERAALLMADMPVKVPAGAPLPAGCQQASDGGFSGLALVPVDRQVAAADFQRPGSARAPASRGLHRSYFARAGERTERTATFTIHPGPMLLVE